MRCLITLPVAAFAAVLSAAASAQDAPRATVPASQPASTSQPALRGSANSSGTAAFPESAPAVAPTEPAEAPPQGFWFWNRTDKPGSIATDRPGFSDSYAVTPRGYSHLEFGYTYSHDSEAGTRTNNHTVGEFSLRTGITDDFELRVKWGGESLTESVYPATSRYAGRHIISRDHDDGGADMSIGFKSPLLRQSGLIPNLSVIPAISLPTGSGSKSTGDADPEVRLAWNYALTDKWSVYGVGLAAAPSDDRGRFFQAGASLATSYQFTPQIGGFVEYYGLYPSTRDSDCQHNIDFGPVFLLNDNMQIDVRAGFGLNEEAPDFIAGIGLCVRF